MLRVQPVGAAESVAARVWNVELQQSIMVRGTAYDVANVVVRGEGVAVVWVDKNHASCSDWGQRRCIPVECFLRYLVSRL